jgi:hypothetical protein
MGHDPAGGRAEKTKIIESLQRFTFNTERQKLRNSTTAVGRESGEK